MSASALPLARLTVDQYHRMIDAGVLTDEDHVELIEGYLVQKTTKNPPHRVALGLLDDLLRVRTPAGWHVANQDPVTLDNSEPEPDLSIVRGEKADYRKQHPGAWDVALVVEVSDSSLEKDRAMAALYARNRIPVYWLVNINEQTVEVYSAPAGDDNWAGYSAMEVVRAGESVPLVIDGHACRPVPVDEIFCDA